MQGSDESAVLDALEFDPMCLVPGHDMDPETQLGALHDEGPATHSITTTCPECGGAGMATLACATYTSLIQLALAADRDSQGFLCEQCFAISRSGDLNFQILPLN